MASPIEERRVLWRCQLLNSCFRQLLEAAAGVCDEMRFRFSRGHLQGIAQWNFRKTLCIRFHVDTAALGTVDIDLPAVAAGQRASSVPATFTVVIPIVKLLRILTELGNHLPILISVETDHHVQHVLCISATHSEGTKTQITLPLIDQEFLKLGQVPEFLEEKFDAQATLPARSFWPALKTMVKLAHNICLDFNPRRRPHVSVEGQGKLSESSEMTWTFEEARCSYTETSHPARLTTPLIPVRPLQVMAKARHISDHIQLRYFGPSHLLQWHLSPSTTSTSSSSSSSSSASSSRRVSKLTAHKGATWRLAYGIPFLPSPLLETIHNIESRTPST